MGAHNLFALFGGFTTPDAMAIRTRDGRALRYKELNKLSARMAGVLCDRGVKPGNRVCVQVEKSPEALALYLACLRFGAIYVPMNTAYTPAEAGYILSDAAPSLVVAGPGASVAAKGVGAAQLETLDGPNGTLCEAAAETAPLDAVYGAGEEEVAAILYTSGTTGKPKGAMLTHGNLSSNTEALVEAWRFCESDTLLHALPIFHAHGLFVAANMTLYSGAQMLMHQKFDADAVVEDLAQATVFMGVPTFYTRLLSHSDFTREATEHMRLFTSGSAPLLPETFDAFEERTGQRILERYGMTETAMIASNLYDGPRIAGSVGAALRDIHIRIVNEAGAPLPAGETGYVEVKGPNVMAGYWNAQEKTAESFTADGYFKTGDQGYLDDTGYLFLVGRAKDMIISGGFNVYPIEIEQLLNGREEVVESAVIGVPHADFGEAVVAIIVPRSGYEVETDILHAELRENLANYKLPKRIVEVDSLPRNTMGKVRKEVLRETYRDLL